MRLYPLPCFREQLLCMFHFWLCNIPVAWCSHWESGEWGHILGWWGKVARHPNNSAFCLAKAVSKTQLWPLLCCLHPALHLASWAPLRGICLSLKWNCWPFKKTRNRRVFLFPLALLGDLGWGCFPQGLLCYFLSTSCHCAPMAHLKYSDAQISPMCLCTCRCYLLGCGCSAPYSFKGRDQGRALAVPCFWYHSYLCRF